MPAPTAVLPTTTHCFSGWNVGRLFRQQAEARPDDNFLIWDTYDRAERSWSYAEFYAESSTIAANFMKKGVSQGDHIVIYLSNTPEFLLSYFACLLMGAIAVTPNRRSAPEELSYFIEKSSARFAITDIDGVETINAAQVSLEWIAIVDCRPGVSLMPSEQSEVIPFDSMITKSSVDHLPFPGALQPAGVQFTSGTTSRPKGVVFTQANILWAGRACSSHIGLDDTDTTLVIAPLFHVNAMFYSVMATLWSGGTVVLVPKFSRRGYWDVVMRYNVSWMSIQPFAIRALSTMDAPSHKLRFLGLGAADVIQLEQSLKVPTIGWWGMTETISQPIHSTPGVKSRFMSMGAPTTEYEIKVLCEKGRQIEPSSSGATGRLFVRGVVGVSMFWEYLDDPESTASAFDENGWFETGDIVIVFDDGEILFGDREKDMLRVGGENVAASEIERAILSVEGVIEAAVVGEPHPMLDETPVAFITVNGVCEGIEMKILKSCGEKLADFKIPKKIIRMDELPRALLDKVSKKDLREILKREP